MRKICACLQSKGTSARRTETVEPNPFFKSRSTLTAHVCRRPHRWATWLTGGTKRPEWRLMTCVNKHARSVNHHLLSLENNYGGLFISLNAKSMAELSWRCDLWLSLIHWKRVDKLQMHNECFCRATCNFLPEMEARTPKGWNCRSQAFGLEQQTASLLLPAHRKIIAINIHLTQSAWSKWNKTDDTQSWLHHTFNK